jgi:ribosomal-protein-alanine N-acetyltransferase
MAYPGLVEQGLQLLDRKAGMFPGELEEQTHGGAYARRSQKGPVRRRLYRQPRIRAPLLRIRQFGPSDVPVIARIVRESLNEVYPTNLYLDIHRWWRSGFLVAEMDGRIAGFVAGILNSPKNARILMIAVPEEVRNLGIGTTLLRAFMAECTIVSVESVELEVRKTNLDAVRFYDRHGFHIAHDIPHFYTDGEDAFKMRRSIA